MSSSNFDRRTYFAHVRESLFGGAMSQEQVDGQNVLLGLWEWQATGTPMKDVRWLSYMLATVYHECATRMWPIEEYGLGDGREYGEIDPETGQVYYGRGFVQLTWRENYRNATVKLSLSGDRDLEWHADRALDCLIAARVLFRGMAEGWFTGKKLGDYFDADTDDPVNARRIINGNDCDTKIAGYYDLFLAAVRAALVEEEEPTTTRRTPKHTPAITLVAITVPAGGQDVAVTVNGEVYEPS